MGEELTKLATHIFNANAKKGFHEEDREKGTLLMLVVSELSEALEADRNNFYTTIIPNQLNSILMKFTSNSSVDHAQAIDEFEAHVKDTEEDEIADAIIRLLDYAGKYKIDIGKHIYLKLLYNRTRLYKHGKEY